MLIACSVLVCGSEGGAPFVRGGLGGKLAKSACVFSTNEFEQIKDHKVFCFSGIARNDDFRHTIKDLGFKVTGFLEFSDHHPYTEKDLATILCGAESTGADRLITTEKDHARIAFNEPLSIELIVVGVKVSFGDNDRDFSAFIQDRLKSVSD